MIVSGRVVIECHKHALDMSENLHLIFGYLLGCD